MATELHNGPQVHPGLKQAGNAGDNAFWTQKPPRRITPESALIGTDAPAPTVVLLLMEKTLDHGGG
jgi:hypothetical protein